MKSFRKMLIFWVGSTLVFSCSLVFIGLLVAQGQHEPRKVETEYGKKIAEEKRLLKEVEKRLGEYYRGRVKAGDKKVKWERVDPIGYEPPAVRRKRAIDRRAAWEKRKRRLAEEGGRYDPNPEGVRLKKLRQMRRMKLRRMLERRRAYEEKLLRKEKLLKEREAHFNKDLVIKDIKEEFLEDVFKARNNSKNEQITVVKEVLEFLNKKIKEERPPSVRFHSLKSIILEIGPPSLDGFYNLAKLVGFDVIRFVDLMLEFKEKFEDKVRSIHQQRVVSGKRVELIKTIIDEKELVDEALWFFEAGKRVLVLSDFERKCVDDFKKGLRNAGFKALIDFFKFKRPETEDF